MKVALLNGSPHKEGCTYTALSEIKEQLNKQDIEAEIYWIGNQPIHGCSACMVCKKTNSGKCVYDDDVCNTLIDKFDEADAIVVGSPVYYAGPNGTLCAILDRVFYAGGSKFIHKPGASVVSCRRGGASATFDRLNKYFTINHMPVVSSQYWNSVHGNTPEEVKQDLEGLQTMRTLANNLVWLLKSLEGTSIPEKEEHIFTNFIR